MTTQTAQSPGPTADAIVEAVDNRYFPDGEVPGLPVILDLRPLLGGKTLAEIDFELLWSGRSSKPTTSTLSSTTRRAS